MVKLYRLDNSNIWLHIQFWVSLEINTLAFRFYLSIMGALLTKVSPWWINLFSLYWLTQLCRWAYNTESQTLDRAPVLSPHVFLGIYPLPLLGHCTSSCFNLSTCIFFTGASVCVVAVIVLQYHHYKFATERWSIPTVIVPYIPGPAWPKQEPIVWRAERADRCTVWAPSVELLSWYMPS